MKCKVLLNNEAVTVIDYEGSEVQIPSIKCNKSFVNVIFDDGRYTVVADNYVEPIVEAEEKPKKKKKTTKNPDESESCIVFE